MAAKRTKLSAKNDVFNGSGNPDIVLALAGNDVIKGGGGDDTLNGGAGNDRLLGGSGRDTLDGGLGADRLVGGSGGDTIVYRSSDDSAAANGAFSAETGDTISGFTSVADSLDASKRDVIDLTVLATSLGQTLYLSGTKAAAWSVWLEDGADFTDVKIDTTGDAIADMAIRMATRETLTLADFKGLEAAPTPPNPPALPGKATLALANDTGISNADKITRDAALTPGNLTNGATLDYSLDGGKSWSATYTAPTTDGTHTVIVRQTNAAGSTQSDPFTFTLDTTAPDNPSIVLNDNFLDPTDNVVTSISFVTGIKFDTKNDRLLASFDNGATYQDASNGINKDPGTYTMLVTSEDKAGNRWAQPYTVTANVVLPPQPAPVYKLDPVDTTSGDSYSHQSAGTFLGSSIAVTDIDSDGFADIIVGASGSGVTGISSGQGFVIGGQFNLAGGDITVPAQKDWNLTYKSGSNLGSNAVAVGDVNGDGFQDFIIGAQFADPTGALNGGQAFLVFGGKSGTLDLAVPDASRFITISGDSANDNLGDFMSDRSGDFNGDGIDDILIGLPKDDTSGNDNGTAHLIFGDSVLNDMTLSGLAAAGTGFSFTGGNSYLGRSATFIGDINGDGFSDIALGEDGGTGKVHVIYGSGNPQATPADIDVTNLGTAGFTIAAGTVFGPVASLGNAIASGDINGDGLDDLLVGARLANGIYGQSGLAFVIYGGQTISDLANLTEQQGFTITGETLGARLGQTVATGDVNGDGYDDVIVGAYKSDKGATDAGSVYVIFGGTDKPASINVMTLMAADGAVFRATTPNFRAGTSLATGDVNADGFDDIIIGSRKPDNSGQVDIIYGRAFKAAAGADQTGTSAGNNLIGGWGDNVLDGRGGADAIRGGAGNDRIIVNDLLFKDLDGGGGYDTLVFGSGTSIVDLLAIGGEKITNFEEIELAGSNQTLYMDLAEISQIGGDRQAGQVVLTVSSSGQDNAVDFNGLSTNWTKTAGTGPHEVYIHSSGNFVLHVDPGLIV